MEDIWRLRHGKTDSNILLNATLCNHCCVVKLRFSTDNQKILLYFDNWMEQISFACTCKPVWNIKINIMGMEILNVLSN